MDEFDKAIQDMMGGQEAAPAPAPASVPASPDSIDAAIASMQVDTSQLDADSDAERQRSLNHEEPISESDATRRASHVDPKFYLLSRFKRAWVNLSPEEQAKLSKIQRRTSNVLERVGGPLAYVFSRPQQELVYKPLLKTAGPEALAKLAATMPEPGDDHAKEVPSQDLHDQLDDVAAQGVGVSWLDKEPQIMEKMQRDVNAEQLYVASEYGGDWGAYQQDLEKMSPRQRLGRQARFMVEDLIAPDPMFLVDKPLMILKAPFALANVADQAIAARKIGVDLKELRGAVKTVEAVHGDYGPLVKHVADLEKKLANLSETASEEAHQRLSRRLVEAKAELAARTEEAKDPGLRLYRPTRRVPQSVYRSPFEMGAEEFAKRQSLADEFASIPDVDAAVKAMRGPTGKNYGDTSDFVREMDRAYDALTVSGHEGTTDEALQVLRDFEKLPEAVKGHLDALGVSRERVLEAAALARGEAADISQHIRNPIAAAARAFLGPDDVEEAATGLAHMRDGGNPAHLTMHAVDAPEHSVVQGAVNDGVFMRDVPSYRELNPDGIRTMSRRDALTHLLGRNVMPGLGVGSTHVDAPSLVKAVNRVGKVLTLGKQENLGAKAMRGLSYFAPLSVSTFVPDVARTYDKASMNYKLFVNEGQEYIGNALQRSGLYRKTRSGTLKQIEGSQKSVDRVIDMLDTDVDPLTGTAPELEHALRNATDQERRLYRDLRAWFDVQGQRLGLDRGKAISGYFPHFFPEGDRSAAMRAPEFLGVNRRAFVNFFALKHRTGAEGWSRDLANVLDIYNRGASRKVVMEPAYRRILEQADAYRAAGKLDEANYTERFLSDARGATRSIFEKIADDANISQGTRDKIQDGVNMMTSLFYKSLLGGNLNYAIQNMAGGTTNAAARHGAFHMLGGLLQFATPEGRRIAKESGVMKEALHSLEGMPTTGKQALEDAYKVMDVGSRAEHFLRGLAVNTSLSQQLNKAGMTWKEAKQAGMAEAFIREAARHADRSQHVFGPLGRSPYLHGLLGHTAYQALAQLGTYPAKQTEFLLRSMSEDPGFIVRYLAYSGIAARMAAESFGIALSPSVGLNFASSVLNPRKNRPVPLAPGPELLLSLIETAHAWSPFGDKDPQEMDRKKKELWAAAEAAVPGLQQFERYSRNLREAFEGHKEKYYERAPLTQVAREVFTGRPEIAKPERKLEQSERIAHALGIQTVQDQIERNERKFKKQEKFDKARVRMEKKRQVVDRKRQRDQAMGQIEESLDAYTEALRVGDTETARRIEEESPAGIRFSSDPAQAAREASFLRSRIRALKRSPGFMKDNP